MAEVIIKITFVYSYHIGPFKPFVHPTNATIYSTTNIRVSLTNGGPKYSAENLSTL